MNTETQDNDNSPALEFRNVSFSFDVQPVLTNVSFTLGRGEMIILTGASGSGKSTLLKLAIGLLKPDAGKIFVQGREIEALDEDALLAIRGGLMGIVFQDESLFTGLTVYENTAYRLAEHGWAEDEVERAVTETLAFVGLSGEENKFPEELSGGMKRRLEIARALIGWPRIMLYDEPTMSLDPIMAIQVLDLVVRTRDIEQISSLYVTKKAYEIPHLANSLASQAASGEVLINDAANQATKTRVIVLEEGKVVFEGDAKSLQESSLPTITELVAFDHHDHANDPYFSNPWDKRRRPNAEAV